MLAAGAAPAPATGSGADGVARGVAVLAFILRYLWLVAKVSAAMRVTLRASAWDLRRTVSWYSLRPV